MVSADPYFCVVYTSAFALAIAQASRETTFGSCLYGRVSSINIIDHSTNPHVNMFHIRQLPYHMIDPLVREIDEISSCRDYTIFRLQNYTTFEDTDTFSEVYECYRSALEATDLGVVSSVELGDGTQCLFIDA